MEMTKAIFDSRKAKDLYTKDSHYRSADFEVPAGHVALVELTTKHDMFDKITFTAIRVPQGISGDCYVLDGVGKRYHQSQCGESFGEKSSGNKTSGSTYTPYKKSMWRLGHDVYNKETYEYRYITRPGNYYLTANKGVSEPIENCSVPTVIEVSIFPASHVLNIHQTCVEGK